jgi:glutamate-1-semialdehyde 2,1-aminomutase
MHKVAPLGPVYQAGTLSGNPLAVAAGLAALRELKAGPEVYERLDRHAARLTSGIAQAAREANVPVTINRVGSMFTVFFGDAEVTDFASASRSDTSRFGAFFRGMLDEGVYLPCSQFEAAFLSAAHTEQDIDDTIAAAGKTFRALAA